MKFKMYFIMELPGLKSRKLYSHQVIFSIKALCHLVSFSYNEDKYGVVQRSLSEILYLLFSLHETMEKEKISKQHKDMCEIEHFRQCITNGIYHIVYTFKDHLHSLPLSPEDHKRVDKFLSFME
ncbi:nucleoporin NDC1-like [Centruroides vittatus]|uniref:nucleoporin NDC1-like n=1 Tax=Centruroides vittatus TaxID=120091 RepID=UPI0035101FD5